MGHVKDRDLKDGTTRFYAEVNLKGFPRLTATFSRKTDTKRWIQQTERVLRCGRNQLVGASQKHTFKDAVERYFKEQYGGYHFQKKLMVF